MYRTCFCIYEVSSPVSILHLNFIHKLMSWVHDESFSPVLLTKYFILSMLSGPDKDDGVGRPGVLSYENFRCGHGLLAQSILRRIIEVMRLPMEQLHLICCFFGGITSSGR